MKVIFMGTEVNTKWLHYTRGGLALRLVADDGEPFATASVNLPDAPCPPDELYIKNYAENSGIVQALVDAGVIQPDPTFQVQSGHVTVSRYPITSEGMNEARAHDPRTRNRN